MDFKRKTISHHEDVYVKYNTEAYKDVGRLRWDPFKMCIRDRYEDDSVFVRNDVMKCDYEILLDHRNYKDVASHVRSLDTEEQ